MPRRPRLSCLLLSLSISASLAPLAAHAAPGYQVAPVGNLGGPAGQPNGINSHGQVVGYAYTAGNAINAYLSTGGVASSLQPPGSASLVGSSAASINDIGDVAGELRYQDGTVHAALFVRSHARDLGTLGGSDSFAYGINTTGQIVGGSYLAGNGAEHAFLSLGKGLQDLGTLGGSNSEARGVNALDAVTGYADIAGDTGYSAFVYADGTMRKLGGLGGDFSEGYAINDAGIVAGYAYLAGNTVSHAVLFRNGSVVDLGGFGGSDSYATAINNGGIAVGAADDAKGRYHAFVVAGGKLHDLGSLIDPSLGWTLNYAGAINDAGQIAAHGCKADGVCADLLLSPVPEPRAFDMSIAGLALLYVLRRWLAT